MDERIIDRKLFIDLANEVGLNASHIEAMGEMRHCEITVSGNMLERLVEIQHQFEQLTVMGDDEYRGFYIVVPRPTPEEWGDVEELIASGEYQSKEAFLADWLAFNPTPLVPTENQMTDGIRIPLPDFSAICRGWLMILLQILMGSTTMWRTICRASNGLGGLHERNSIG